MPTYSGNYQIKLIATGDESGTWGNSTNENLKRLEQTVSGTSVVDVQVPPSGSIWTPGTRTLDFITSNTSDSYTSGGSGRSGFLVFTSSNNVGGSATVNIRGNTGSDLVDRIFFVKNALTDNHSLILDGGSGPDVTIANGCFAVVNCYTGATTAGLTTESVNNLLSKIQVDNIQFVSDAEIIIPESSATAFEITTGNASDEFIRLDTANNSVDLAPGSNIGSVDITADTTITGTTTVNGSTLDVNSTTVDVDSTTVDIDATTVDIGVADAESNAFRVAQGANEFIRADTSTDIVVINQDLTLGSNSTEIVVSAASDLNLPAATVEALSVFDDTTEMLRFDTFGNKTVVTSGELELLSGTTLDLLSGSTLDVNGVVDIDATSGNIDGVNIGATSNGTGRFTTLTSTAGLDVDSGGIDVTAGGISVTAGGIGVTAGGVTVNAGGVTVTGASSVTGALTVSSLDAGDGTIGTTGNLNGGTTSVGALTASSLGLGSGNITTTGTINSGAITSSGQVSGSSISAGSITGTSLGLGSGNITTTGTISSGGITSTSLNAGSGTIQTTGTVVGDVVSGTTSLGAPAVTGSTSVTTPTLTSVGPNGNLTVSPSGAGRTILESSSASTTQGSEAIHINASAGRIGLEVGESSDHVTVRIPISSAPTTPVLQAMFNDDGLLLHEAGGGYLNFSSSTGSGGNGFRADAANDPVEFRAKRTGAPNDDDWGRVYHSGMASGDGAYFEGSTSYDGVNRTFTIAHTLSVAAQSSPRIVQVYAKRVASGTARGIAQYEYIHITGSRTGYLNGQNGHTVRSDDTNVYIDVANQAGGICVIAPDNHLEYIIPTNGDYELVVRAWK